MSESTKINFQHRRIRQMEDVTDLVEMLFPGNRNQQHAAARILLFLRDSTTPQRTLAILERQYDISRRTLQRTRAKLARLGLIEHASGLAARHGGAEGWTLSGRMGTALRHLADRIDQWRYEDRQDKKEKELVLAGLLGVEGPGSSPNAASIVNQRVEGQRGSRRFGHRKLYKLGRITAGLSSKRNV